MAQAKTRIIKAAANWKGGGLQGKIDYLNGVKLDFDAPPPLGPRKDLITPEGSLVAALCMCYSLTLVAFLQGMKIEVSELEVRGTGEAPPDVGPGKGLIKAELKPIFKVKKEDKDKALQAVTQAKDFCFVANSIKAPITLAPEIKTV
jgi:organic hydroperoxide reductase OsmC/OhrA